MKLWPLFNRAADAMTAWRKQQEAALNAQQRARYDQLRKEQERREKHKEHEQLAAREKLVVEERRRLLLQKPAPALRLFTPRPVRQARLFYIARRNVKARQALELRAVRQDGQKRVDAFLQKAQEQRERPSAREKFDEAARDRVDAMERMQQVLMARAAERKRAKGDDGRER